MIGYLWLISLSWTLPSPIEVLRYLRFSNNTSSGNTPHLAISVDKVSQEKIDVLRLLIWSWKSCVIDFCQDQRSCKFFAPAYSSKSPDSWPQHKPKKDIILYQCRKLKMMTLQQFPTDQINTKNFKNRVFVFVLLRGIFGFDRGQPRGPVI